MTLHSPQPMTTIRVPAASKDDFGTFPNSFTYAWQNYKDDGRDDVRTGLRLADVRGYSHRTKSVLSQ